MVIRLLLADIVRLLLAHRYKIHHSNNQFLSWWWKVQPTYKVLAVPISNPVCPVFWNNFWVSWQTQNFFSVWCWTMNKFVDHPKKARTNWFRYCNCKHVIDFIYKIFAKIIPTSNCHVIHSKSHPVGKYPIISFYKHTL